MAPRNNSIWSYLRWPPVLDTDGLLLATDGAGEDMKAATTRREEESLKIDQYTLQKISVVIVLQEEGIIYCPIPKVNGQRCPSILDRRLHVRERAVLGFTHSWRPTVCVAILACFCGRHVQNT